MTRARDVANLIGSGNYSSTTFTATAGQTAFTISHTQGFIQVFMNGLLLDETVDYTSNGSAVTLTSGAAAGDEIEVVKYNTFSVGDALPKSGGAMTGALTVDAAGATPLTVDRATSDGTIIDVQRDGTSVGTIDSLASSGIAIANPQTNGFISLFGHNQSNGIFYEDGSSKRFAPYAARDNDIDLGYTTGRWKDLYLSGGAYLGGTGAANKLDDYEEGTYTATSNVGTIQYGTGWYIRVGDFVHVSTVVGVFSNITSNAVIQISLPFTTKNQSGLNNHGAVMPRYVNSGGRSLTAYAGHNTAAVGFYISGTSSNNWDAVKFNYLSNVNAYLRFSLSYWINT